MNYSDAILDIWQKLKIITDKQDQTIQLFKTVLEQIKNDKKEVGKKHGN